MANEYVNSIRQKPRKVKKFRDEGHSCRGRRLRALRNLPGTRKSKISRRLGKYLIS